MTPTSLLELWEDLAAGPPASSGLDRRLLAVDAPVDVYAAVFWPSGRSGLLVEGQSIQRPADGRIPKCRGVRVVHQITSTAPQKTVLQISLEDARLIDIFAVLCADLVELSQKGSSPAEALRSCLDRVSMWQALFERIPAEGLSAEEQRGLFGELVTFEQLMMKALDPLEAVTAWTGPEPKNQDFIHGGIAVEVKTSLAKRHSRLIISNEKQLDERPHEKLFLAHVRLDESATHGATLPGMVARCRDIVKGDPVAAQLLERRLMAGGYLDVHAPLYSANSWKASSLRFFEVQGDFPRLTEANLPAGVGDIHYSIVADDLVPYEARADDVVANLKANANV